MPFLARSLIFAFRQLVGEPYLPQIVILHTSTCVPETLYSHANIASYIE